VGTGRDRLLSGDAFEGETFEGLELPGARLEGKDFSGCTFRNLKLAESRWDGARLEDCVFDDCDLTRLLPGKLALRGVEFRRCKMMGIEWAGLAPHPDMRFSDCNLRYCSFIALRAGKTPFVRCTLLEASFVDMDLAGSAFDDCQLDGARFEGCDLRGATFATSRGLRLDPARNRVQGTIVGLEVAVLLAGSFGLKVVGFQGDVPE
jgi:fluoroquinolone resistance protein